ncbi:hypothetical protein [Cohnella sp. JJ-181]|uniref:hypothetical protein n=1 Tax=Cohnella rhizoplanae TaxID=2974897 RepID=UPI00232B3911|nr:hypothetical protein [Cohnella sp. JJ-181]
MEGTFIFIHDQPYPLYYWIVSLSVILVLVGFLVRSERVKRRAERDREREEGE